MNIYFLVFLLTIVIIVPVLFRSKIKALLLSYKKRDTRVKVARTLLKINLWISVPLGLAFAILLQGLGHGGTNDWLFFMFMVLGFTGFLLLISYLALVSFSNKNIFSQIYIWGFCVYLMIFGFPLFTIFGILIVLGQLTWYKTHRENK